MYEITEQTREQINRITVYHKTLRTLDKDSGEFTELDKFYLKEINTLFLELGMNLYWTIKEQSNETLPTENRQTVMENETLS